MSTETKSHEAGSNGHTWSLRKYDVPQDSDDSRYVKSFHLDEEEAFKQFFDKFGFVVVRDVASKEDCEKTIDEMWTVVSELGKRGNVRVDRNDPSTWGNETWPGHKSGGFLGDIDIPTPQAFANRQNPNIYKVFKTLFGREDLLASYDRYALFRPTKSVKIGGAVEDKPEWSTDKNLHIDMNPFNYVNGKKEDSEAFANSIKYERLEDFFDESDAVSVGVMSEGRLSVQGQLNLADNLLEDGGFLLVPGFKHHIEEWTKHTDTKYGKLWDPQSGFCPFPQDDVLIQNELRITARAGSLIVWNQLSPHGSSPCGTAKGRYTQFIKVIPSTLLTEKQKKNRVIALRKQLQLSNFENKVSPLGAKLFGLENGN